jgi:hypothetical protein
MINRSCSLHNLSLHPPNAPLVIFLPPFPSHDEGFDGCLPASLRSHPTAVIHYRWPGLSLDSEVPDAERQVGETKVPPPLVWPTPIHDVLFAYSWITQKLAPPNSARRDVYIYGSHLGATLGASLALTESRTHRRISVRGLVAINGIYNWTMFLPDHAVQKARRAHLTADAPDETEGTAFHYLKMKMPALFHSAANLFDPFASPSLFFHNPGLWVPEDFTTEQPFPMDVTRAMGALSLNPSTFESIMGRALERKAPRKSHLIFPPRKSTLRIPETLLLHENSPPFPRAGRRRQSKVGVLGKKTKVTGEHNFEVQACELATLMRRSLAVARESEEEIEKRVGVANIGQVGGDQVAEDRIQEQIGTWLEDIPRT